MNSYPIGFKRILLFYLGIILFPNINFTYFRINFRLWMLLSLVLLVPTIIKNFRLNYRDKYDYGIIILIVMRAVPFMFVSLNEGLYELLYGLLCFVAPYFAIKYSLNSTNDLKIFYKFILYTSILVFLIGIAEFTIQKSFYFEILKINNPDSIGYLGIDTGTFRSAYLRVSTNFTHPIYLGVYACFVLILITFQKTIINFRKVNTQITLFIIITGITNVVVSQSRSSAVAFIIVLLIFSIKKRLQYFKEYLYFIIFSFIAIITINIFYINIFNDIIYYNVLANDADSNWVYRINVIYDVIPIFINNFNFIGEKAFGNQAVSSFLSNVDLPNGFIKSLMLEGASYVILLLVLWVNLIQKSLKFSYKNSVYNIVYVVLLYYFIVNNITLIKLQNEIILFMHFGLVARSKCLTYT